MIELNYEITIYLPFFLGLAFGFVISGGYIREQGIADNNGIFNRRLVISLYGGCYWLWLRLRFSYRFR